MSVIAILRQQPEFEWLCLTHPKVLIDTRRMAETIEVGSNLSYTASVIGQNRPMIIT
jgi:hypothetical protein